MRVGAMVRVLTRSLSRSVEYARAKADDALRRRKRINMIAKSKTARGYRRGIDVRYCARRRARVSKGLAFRIAISGGLNDELWLGRSEPLRVVLDGDGSWLRHRRKSVGAGWEHKQAACRASG